MTMVSYMDFLRAVVGDDIAVIESYFTQDEVREEVATAELSYQRMTRIDYRTRAYDFMVMRRDPQSRVRGAECLIQNRYEKIHIDVLTWFFSPGQIPTMGYTLAYLFTPIAMLVCKNGDLEALEALLSSQVFLRLLGSQKLQNTILDDLLRQAWGEYSPETIELLFAHGAQCEPAFARDFVSGPLGRAKPIDDYALLFSHGIPVIGGHEFALSAAMMNGPSFEHWDQIKRLLIFSRWDPSIVAGELLLMAARNEEGDLLRFCLKTGLVDVDARSSNEQTALMVASHRVDRFWRREDALAARLRWEGYDPRQHDTPYVPSKLQYETMSYARRQFIQTLLAHGADPNLQHKYGHTALHHAVKRGCPEAVPMLLKAGADIHVRTNANESVLDQIDLGHIAMQDVQALFLLLVEHGASPFTYGKYPRSVLDRLLETEDGVAFVLAHEELFQIQRGWIVGDGLGS